MTGREMIQGVLSDSESTKSCESQESGKATVKNADGTPSSLTRRGRVADLSVVRKATRGLRALRKGTEGRGKKKADPLKVGLAREAVKPSLSEQPKSVQDSKVASPMPGTSSQLQKPEVGMATAPLPEEINPQDESTCCDTKEYLEEMISRSHIGIYAGFSPFVKHSCCNANGICTDVNDATMDAIAPPSNNLSDPWPKYTGKPGLVTSTPWGYETPLKRTLSDSNAACGTDSKSQQTSSLSSWATVFRRTSNDCDSLTPSTQSSGLRSLFRFQSGLSSRGERPYMVHSKPIVGGDGVEVVYKRRPLRLRPVDKEYCSSSGTTEGWVRVISPLRTKRVTCASDFPKEVNIINSSGCEKQHCIMPLQEPNQNLADESTQSSF